MTHNILDYYFDGEGGLGYKYVDKNALNKDVLSNFNNL
jgi:hypothetical protein